MKNNWKIKVQNPAFWYYLIIGVFSIIGTYFGIKGADMTSWKAVTDTLGAAIANPYLIWLVLVFIVGLFISLDTYGASDSAITMAKSSLDQSTVEIVKTQIKADEAKEAAVTNYENTEAPTKTEETTAAESQAL